MTCDHEDFVASVVVNRLKTVAGGPVTGFSCDVRVECAECQEPMVFIGAPLGLLATEPTRSVDGTELHAPLRPQSAPIGFGTGLPGFTVTVREASGYGVETN
jgi:hypothetical protein